MDRIGAHPYISSIVAAAALLTFGALVVYTRSGTAPSDTASTWSGTGAFFNESFRYASEPPAQTSAREESSLLAQVTSSAPFVYLPPAGNAAPSAQGGESDFAAFIKELTNAKPRSDGAGTAPAGGSTAPISDAYSFIPRGIVSIRQEPTRTEAQQALYDYGNVAGAIIQTFETTHPGTPQILQDQIADRENTEKGNAVRRVGQDLAAIGHQLLAIEDAPAPVASAHAALAQSYIEIGERLAQVPDALRDEEFIEAIRAYNARADVFISRYTALALIFPAHGVSFDAADAGSVFSFTPTGS